MSDITVVISNFNYARFVNSAIESCLSQTLPCKIIVVDDASTDNSWKVIRGYKDDGIVAVRLNKNSNGNARGKNVGICLSATKYVTCLDADDMLLPNSLELRMPFPDDVDFVHGWSRRISGNANYQTLLREVRPKKFSFDARSKKLMKEAEHRWAFAIDASTVLASRSIYERLGLYDEEMRWSIDREMWYRWLGHGARKKVIPQYVSFYRKHPGQVTRDRKKKDPRRCASMLSQRTKLRKIITPENTMFMENYDYQSFIGKIE